MAGHEGSYSTEDIKQMYGRAPFVVLALPGNPVLNDEVRIGYRTYGPAETKIENT